MPPEKTPEGIEYWTITTTDDKGDNAIAGGLMKRIMPEQQGITNYIDVESVDEYSAKVEQLGGKVRMPKMAIPGMGYLELNFWVYRKTASIIRTYLNNGYSEIFTFCTHDFSPSRSV